MKWRDSARFLRNGKGSRGGGGGVGGGGGLWYRVGPLFCLKERSVLCVLFRSL